MKIDKSKIIAIKPLMLCEACFKENCNGNCILLVRILRKIKSKFKPKTNKYEYRSKRND